MPTCKLQPDDKRAFAQAVGNDLLKHHGKRKSYSPSQVRDACDRLGFAADWHCWAMALYCAPADFAAYHEAIGEVCDQASMKSEMAAALTDGASEAWFDVDLSWLDWPDVDLSGIFDFVDFS